MSLEWTCPDSDDDRGEYPVVFQESRKTERIKHACALASDQRALQGEEAAREFPSVLLSILGIRVQDLVLP